MIKRALKDTCFDNKFGRQMRFIVGPRQAGKTFLAREFLKEVGNENLYYNWDKRIIRQAYRKEAYFFQKDLFAASGDEKPWICFDEIHKMPRWKNILKDFFDSFEEKCRFIITGSARLDLLRYTGESLLGRYFTFRLFPLRLIEVEGALLQHEKIESDAIKFIERCLSAKHDWSDSMSQLINCSGFPEPFTSGSAEFAVKWQHDYLDHFIKEDLRDMTNIPELENVFQLVELLPSKIGAPLSLNSLREDIEVSHTAVRNWLRALKLTCVLFFLKPFSKRVARSVKKETKCYFFDWTRNTHPANRFENYCAVELKAFANAVTDAGLGELDLCYMRTKEGNETDFLLTLDKRPWFLLEAKRNETQISKHHYSHSKLLGGIPFVQLIEKPGALDVREKRFFVVSAGRFFSSLPM